MSIQSEYHPLVKVVVHQPGYEWNLVTVEHDMQEKYLIEDILFTEAAASDHAEFTDCIKHAVGDESVIEFKNLLSDILADTKVRSNLIGAIAVLERLDNYEQKLLLSDKFDHNELAELLIVGAFKNEDKKINGYSVLFPPIPNLLFTRDIGIFFNDAVILSHPTKTVRRREGLLARFIFSNHPFFKDVEIIDIQDEAKSQGLQNNSFLEGGDMLALDSETLLIGCSERTTSVAIDLLTKRLLMDNIAKRIIKIDMPNDRATMHLDTVFTIVGKDDCVYYSHYFSDDKDSIACPCSTYELVDGEVQMVHESAPLSIFASLERLGYNFQNRIKCGGDIPHYQKREQWTDGANLFAVLPRVAFIYERNKQTINAFKDIGYSIVSPIDFLKLDIQSMDKILITLSGAELSRGRGGARCMTMPIKRKI